MVLVVDSGSTKADWQIIDNGQRLTSFKTSGMNPYFLNATEIKNEIINAFPLTLLKDAVKRIVFFGAGCSTVEKKNSIASVLTSIFTQSNIEVHTDMFGAAKALFDKEEGIAVILGTGSNSCVWDGESIITTSPSLGYILGDEGSGSHLGLTLIKKYLTNDLPSELKTLFENSYPISREIILENVYRKPNPNRYLAHFTYFLKENISHPYITYLVTDCFLQFFATQIKVFDNFNHKKVRCVGSIAYHFKDLLHECALASEIELDTIIQTPIESLVDIYTQL